MTYSLLDAIERPSILGFDRDDEDRDAPTQTPSVGGEPTLDEVLTGTWEALLIGRAATCVICEAPMEARYSAGHTPVGGRCTSCGTELS
jgi:hypothetical protein